MSLLEACSGAEDLAVQVNNAFGERFEQGRAKWPPLLFEFLAKGVFCYLEKAE
jgi:hypothetical protein